ncbi:MAG: glycosyltransferase [Candidatus Eremiobacterota bacterium]
MRTRLLFVVRSLIRAGVERTALTLSDHFEHPGRTHFLALMEGHGDLIAQARRPGRLLVPRVMTRHIPGREDLLFIARSMARHPCYCMRLRSLLRRVRPHLLFTHSGVDMLAVGALTPRGRIPWVAGVGSDALAGIAQVHPHLRPFFRAFLATLYPLPDRLVAASLGLRQVLLDHYGLSPERVTVIPNPVDQRVVLEQARAPLPKESPEGYVLGVGRLVAGKGFDLLLRAFARTSLRERLVLLGEGPERPGLLRLASELGVADRVDMPGSDPNPFRYMARARAVVVTSRSEGFGNILLEAMTCGAPVVAFDNHGPRDLIRPGVDGELVGTGDVEALGRALQDLLASPERLRALSLAGRERARDYSAERICGRYSQLFTEVLGR